MGEEVIKVYINPTYSGPDRADGGIRRVVEAQTRYLSSFDVEVVDNPDYAQVIMNHGTVLEERPGVPMIACCHGLYWHDYPWQGWAEEANRRVIEVMARADAVTAPSNWVARALSRGMAVEPRVIYHGVEIDDWSVEASRNYILWNKARVDPVSDPVAVSHLATLLPDKYFVSTFGEEASNVRITGPVVYDKMKPIIQSAGVYLATVRETMGIGTLEALACGVPVVGWDFGGQSEVIRHEETGILVPYGDYQLLAYAIEHVLIHRDFFSANAREDAELRWGWYDKVKQYADLIHEVYQWRQLRRPKVSVVVTVHNLIDYVIDALGSVANQDGADWECIVVDDASTDGSERRVEAWIDELDEEVGEKFSLKVLEANVGLSEARNVGWKLSRGDYVIFLDGDDMLADGALRRLAFELNRDPSIHIAYGPIDVMDHEGKHRRRNPWPTGQFNWFDQISHLNQMSYSSMMRRRVLEATGGYRRRDWRSEDASFWLRATSLGFRASNVTDDATLVYRMRSDSKTASEHAVHKDKDGDWTYMFPWRTGAATGEEGTQAKRRGDRPNPYMVPFGAQGAPPAPHKSWPVRHHQNPLVSVIIPVGPGHAKYLPDALDSLIAQTLPQWEAIIVDDTAELKKGVMVTEVTKDLLKPYSWAKVIRSYEYTDSRGAGSARNLGIANSKAPYLVFLDADDLLLPRALELMTRAISENKGGYAYGDCVSPQDPRKWDVNWTYHKASDYDRSLFLRSGYSDDKDLPGRHLVTAMVAREDARRGFDESIPFWEDWEFFLHLAAEGVCGRYIPEPMIVYRLDTGKRRVESYKHESSVSAYLRKRYEHLAEETEPMCNCGKASKKTLAAAEASLQDVRQEERSSRQTRFAVKSDQDGGRREAPTKTLQYIGERGASVTYRGAVTRRQYVAGKLSNEFIVVDEVDVPGLIRTRDFRLVEDNENVGQGGEASWAR